jgi:hypothetical protein
VPNQFVNTSWVSMEILRILQNSLEVADTFSTDWESEFGKTFAVGSSVQIKLPQRFLVTDGLGYQPQAFNRLTTTVNLDQIFGIHFEWDSYERLVKMERSQEELTANYLKPAARQLAQEIDSRAALFAYQNASNVFGVLGTDPTTIVPFLSAERRLYEKACPDPEKKLILSASAMASYIGPNVTQFNPASEISRAYKTGVIGNAGGWEWRRSNSLWSHTAGTWAGAVTVNGAGQSGSSLTITATAGDTFKVGDKFSIANVNMVNPSTRRVPGALSANHFTITQALVAAGGGVDVINFLPAIFGPGSQYQNVDALAASGAALTSLARNRCTEWQGGHGLTRSHQGCIRYRWRQVGSAEGG